MPKVKASDLKTNVHVTKVVDGAVVRTGTGVGWFGPDYPDRANETVELADGHPALVAQRLSAEDVDRLRRENEFRTALAQAGVPVGVDLRQLAADFGVNPEDVPSLRALEAEDRATAGITPDVGAVGAGAAVLPPLPEGWDNRTKAELETIAFARGATVAPNATKDDLVETIRATGA